MADGTVKACIYLEIGLVWFVEVLQHCNSLSHLCHTRLVNIILDKSWENRVCFVDCHSGVRRIWLTESSTPHVGQIGLLELDRRKEWVR